MADCTLWDVGKLIGSCVRIKELDLNSSEDFSFSSEGTHKIESIQYDIVDSICTPKIKLRCIERLFLLKNLEIIKIWNPQ